MKKRLISLALALALCLGLTVPAFAEEAETSAEFYGWISAESYPYVWKDLEYQQRSFDKEKWDNGKGVIYSEAEEYTGSYLAVPTHEYFYVGVDGLAKDEVSELWIEAFTDHDGDGVYDKRIFLTKEGASEFTVLPIPEDDVYEVPKEGTVRYDALADTIPGFEKAGEGDYMVSAARLHEVFGDNTLIDFYFGLENAIYLGGALLSAGAFDDVPGVGWYSEPIAWAADKGITKGTGYNEFMPGDDCTQLQILTFLSRAAGNTNTADYDWTTEQEMVKKWATEKGMIDDSFDGGEPCTRAIAVNYIWQAFDKPAAAAASGFKDMEGYEDYAQAVDWAKEKGIAKGSDGEFGPGDVCSRAEIATFLWRAYNNKT